MFRAGLALLLALACLSSTSCLPMPATKTKDGAAPASEVTLPTMRGLTFASRQGGPLMGLADPKGVNIAAGNAAASKNDKYPYQKKYLNKNLCMILPLLLELSIRKIYNLHLLRVLRYGISRTGISWCTIVLETGRNRQMENRN